MIKQANKSDLDELEDSLLSDESILDSSLRPRKKAEKSYAVNNSILLDIISDQTKAKFIWQCVSAGMVVLFIISAFMCFSLFKSNQNLNEKVLNYAKLEPKLIETKSENEKLQAEAFQAANDLKSAKNELNDYISQNAKLQEELDSVSTQLKDLQDRNAEVVKILNGRLQKLSNTTR
jgi:septal ring factor EnvC (AmiA/AmiB activator)